MRMDLGTRNTLLYDFMHCMTAVSLGMSDEPYFLLIANVSIGKIYKLFCWIYFYSLCFYTVG